VVVTPYARAEGRPPEARVRATRHGLTPSLGEVNAVSALARALPGKPCYMQRLCRNNQKSAGQIHFFEENQAGAHVSHILGIYTPPRY
jgi:hypothetical protein